MDKQRNHVPCRRCGAAHTNKRSSSLCPDCGEIEASANAVARARAEDAAIAAEETKLRELDDAETVHELREWIKEYMI